MEKLLIECARRDLQMVLQAIVPNHIEVLVSCKMTNIQGIEIPIFNPMEICLN